MKSTFQRNLLIGFGLSLTLLIVSSVASFTSIRNLLGSAEWVNHTHEVIPKLETVPSMLRDAATSQRVFLLPGQEDFLAPYNGVEERVMTAVEEIRELTGDNL